MKPLTKEEKEFCKQVGQRIVAIRKKKKMTQRALAYKLDIEDSNLRRIEKGRTNPTLITLYRIAKALKEPLCLLVEDE